MTIESASAFPNQFPPQLISAKSMLYDPCGFHLSNYRRENESHEYGACRFQLNGCKVIFRTAKITPTKTGQFVTLWKRNQSGITEPFDANEDVDYIIVSALDGDRFGQFVFPKKLLLEKGILSGPYTAGKRGIRVYPAWDTAVNQQAAKTQAWQTAYFVDIQNDPVTAAICMGRLLFSTTKQ